MRRSSQARNIQDAIRAVLLRDWDPIGVRDVREAQDEYDGYMGDVYHLIANGVSAEELAEHLARIERDSMGLSARGQDCMDVALRLKQIDIAMRPG